MSQSTQYPPETISVSEGPEIGQTVRPSVPTKALNSDYPVQTPALRTTTRSFREPH